MTSPVQWLRDSELLPQGAGASSLGEELEIPQPRGTAKKKLAQARIEVMIVAIPVGAILQSTQLFHR